MHGYDTQKHKKARADCGKYIIINTHKTETFKGANLGAVMPFFKMLK